MLPEHLLCRVMNYTSPWTSICMSLTCKTLRAYSTLKSLPKYSGPLTISDVTVISVIDESTILFSCESMYGKDPLAQQYLYLIDDYWGCTKPRYSSFIRTSVDGKRVFIGRLRGDSDRSIISWYGQQSVSLRIGGQLTHITHDSWFKDVKVYISPRQRASSFEVEIKIRSFVTIKQVAVSTLDTQGMWDDFVVDARAFLSIEYFCCYKYLEHVLGETEASAHLMRFETGRARHAATLSGKFQSVPQILGYPPLWMASWLAWLSTSNFGRRCFMDGNL